MRRFVLGPVIMFVAIAGLIVAVFGHAAYAHASGKKESKTLSGKKEKPTAADNQIASDELPDLWLARDCPGAHPDPAADEGPVGIIEKVINSAMSCIGVPYQNGGTTPGGFDCSGFVRYVYGMHGISLSRTSRDQAKDGVPVELGNIRPGDLIFFKMRQRQKAQTPIDHVGLYLGDGKFIHAANSRRSGEIKVEDLDVPHYLPKVVEARRVIVTVQ